MKTPTLTSMLAAALCVAGNDAAQAQTWQTVDLFNPSPALYGIAADIGTGADGRTLYSVGSVELNSAGEHYATVRMSTDSGASWMTVDNYMVAGWNYASYRGFGAGANGSLFAGGELWNDATQTRMAIIRQSDDGGASWATVEAFQPTPTGQASYGDVKMNPYSAGDVYAVGFSIDAGLTSSWAVRKRAAGAATFTTVDLFGSGAYMEARAVAFHPTAGVFVVGRTGVDRSNVQWAVRRSPTGEPGTWVTVDTFQDTLGGYAIARGITVGPAPSYPVYVCGQAIQKLSGKIKLVNNWVVRRGLNGGTTWAVVDRFGAERADYGAGYTVATAVTLSQSGKVFVTGEASVNAPGPTHHLVRKGTTAQNGTMTWVTSDDFQFASGQDSGGYGITSDIYGNIFSAGKAETDSTGVGYFLTRRLNGPQ